MCERELETEQNCNILTPTLMAISVSFPFSWATQPGTWSPALSCVLAFSTTSCLQTLRSPNWLNFLCTELYNSSTPTPLEWHVFDRHRAEITAMQFTGHPLPVHQFVTVLWDFNPVPYCQPSSPTPMEYALPPSLEFQVWPGRRSIYNSKTVWINWKAWNKNVFDNWTVYSC